jgi:5-methylcytosine-specific restriction endonuclease McrA
MERINRRYDVFSILRMVIPKENKGPKKRIDLDGDMVSIESNRLAVFKRNLVCCSCGVVGRFFVKERNCRNKYYHLNLYALGGDGEEILMTKDHIIPKCRGGKSHIKNYQTMCRPCNVRKGGGTQHG